MNFEGLNPSLAEYAPPLLDPVLDAHLNPSLVELDPEGVSLEGMAVPESVHLMEGMYSELHTAVSEVGVPVSVSHFDLHEEMLWVGNHGVRVGCLQERDAMGSWNGLGLGGRGKLGWVHLPPACSIQAGLGCPLGSPFQGLTTLTGWNFFPRSRLSLL